MSPLAFYTDLERRGRRLHTDPPTHPLQNTRQIANITLDDNVGNRTTMTVTVTDNSGTEWYVPLTWIDRAVQRVIAHNDAVNRARRDDPAADNDPNLADVTFELESDDGTTGHLRLSDVLDATTDAAGSHDAEAS